MVVHLLILVIISTLFLKVNLIKPCFDSLDKSAIDWALNIKNTVPPQKIDWLHHCFYINKWRENNSVAFLLTWPLNDNEPCLCNLSQGIVDKSAEAVHMLTAHTDRVNCVCWIPSCHYSDGRWFHMLFFVCLISLFPTSCQPWPAKTFVHCCISITLEL